MSSQIYSRQYLRELPEMQRRQIVQNDVFRLVQQMEQRLKAAALKGETRYLHDMSSWVAEKQQNDYQQMREQQILRQNEENNRFGRAMLSKMQVQPEAPSDELLAGLKEKFPDCAVSFHEDWVETRQDVRVLKKGILIDWS